MKRITKILLPVDFSEPSANAFRYALRLADKTGATIQVNHIVFPEGESLDYPILVARATQQRLEIARDHLKKFVETGLTAVGQILKNVPAVSSDIEVGTPVSSICATARKEEVDLIVIGSRGENRRGLEKWIGSVAAGVVAKCECPVLVIPESAQFENIEKVAYATDVKDSDPFEVWRTTELIKPFTPVIDLVHVNLKKEGDSKAWDKLEDMKEFFEERSPGMQTNFHNIPGEDLQNELNDFIADYDINMLVMYQPHHNFWERLFYRSATKEMAIQTKVPLLVMKNK